MKLLLRIFFAFLLMTQNASAQEELTLLTTFSGEYSGDAFANIVGLGDVNNDGMNDFLVNTKSAKKHSYAKLYFGGSPFDTLDCMKLSYSEYGYGVILGDAVAGRGDLNGDGINDFAMITLSCRELLVYEDKVRIFYGGTEIDTIPELIFDCPFDTYGPASKTDISICGDLNGDGYDDVVISLIENYYDQRGSVYIYFGGEEMDTEYDVKLVGEEIDDGFGVVSIVGDTNGDGYDDLAVGTKYGWSYENHSTAYLFYGGTRIGYNHSEKFVGDSTARKHGIYLKGLGDVDNDGFEDICINYYTYVEVISGYSLVSIGKLKYVPEQCYATSISSGYDLNMDGYLDFLVGSNHNSNIYLGEVLLYHGGEEIDTPSIVINGTEQLNYFGTSVDILGDINNDGMIEVAVGEMGEIISSGIIGTGRVYIYTYNKTDSNENGFNALLIPSDFTLFNNYPNPFNPVTTIKYKLNKRLDVNLEVYSVTGEKIKTLVNKNQVEGNYTVIWNGVNENDIPVSSGVYILKLRTRDGSNKNNISQKMIKAVLLK